MILGVVQFAQNLEAFSIDTRLTRLEPDPKYSNKWAL